MARKARVKVLRGTRTAIAGSDEKLEKGELLLDTTDGYIIAGIDDGVYANNSSCIIKAREVVGYANDSSTLNGSSYADKKYSVSCDTQNNSLVVEGNNVGVIVKSTSNGVTISSPKSNISLTEGTAESDGVAVVTSGVILHNSTSSIGMSTGESGSERTSVYLDNASGNVSLGSTGKINLNTNTNISSDGNTLNVGQVAKIGNIEIDNSSNKNQIKVDNVVGHSNQTTINGNILKSNEIDTTTLKVDSISNNSSTNITINSGNNDVVVNGNTNVSSDGKKLTVGSIAIDNTSGNNLITVGNVSVTTKVSTPKVENGDNAVDIANISNVSTITGNSNQTNINGNILTSNEIDTTTVKVDSISNNSSNSPVTINGNTSIGNDGNTASIGLVEIAGTTDGSTFVNASTFNGNLSGDVEGNISGTYGCFSSYVSTPVINNSGAVTINTNTSISEDGNALIVGDVTINEHNISFGEHSSAIWVQGPNSLSIGNTSAIPGVDAVQIGTASKTIARAVAIGNNANASTGYGDSIAIGNNANAGAGGIGCRAPIAIGNNASAGGQVAESPIAIGNNAHATGSYAIQLGNGSNTNASTLQFMNTKIADGSGNVFTGFSKDWLQDKTVSQMIDDLFCGNQSWGVIVVTSNISDQGKSIGIFTRRPFSRPTQSSTIAGIFGIQAEFYVGAESSQIDDSLTIKYPSGNTDSLSYEDKPYYKIIF